MDSPSGMVLGSSCEIVKEQSHREQSRYGWVAVSTAVLLRWRCFDAADSKRCAVEIQ